MLIDVVDVNPRQVTRRLAGWLLKLEEPACQTARHLPWVYVDDVDEHYRRAGKAGATIVKELASPWGLPMYTAADPEGCQWTFAQARPTMR